jgi:hypothetical protein
MKYTIMHTYKITLFFGVQYGTAHVLARSGLEAVSIALDLYPAAIEASTWKNGLYYSEKRQINPKVTV